MPGQSETQRGGKASFKKSASLRFIGAMAIAIGVIFATIAFVSASNVLEASAGIEEADAHYRECDEAVRQLGEASDYLTTMARMYVVTGREENLDNYLVELDETNRRGQSVRILRANVQGSKAASDLENALAYSDYLAKREMRAMRLAADYYGLKKLPSSIASVQLRDSEREMGKDGKIAEARELVLGEAYDATKNRIQESAKASSEALLERLDSELAQMDDHFQNVMLHLRISVALLLCVLLLLVLAMFMYVYKPLRTSMKLAVRGEPLKTCGAEELRYMQNAYNDMRDGYEEQLAALRQEAEMDLLTGLANLNGCKAFLEDHTENIALLLMDIDDFKSYNDSHGYDTGDAALVKFAEVLEEAFRDTDLVARTGGNEFAVVMSNTRSNHHGAVSSKVERVKQRLADSSDGVPALTFTAGVSFASQGSSYFDIFRAADTALYRAKKAGFDGLSFEGDPEDGADAPQDAS